VSVDYGANIHVFAKKFTVGEGHHAHTIKTPLAGIEVVAYDKEPGTCPSGHIDFHHGIQIGRAHV